MIFTLVLQLLVNLEELAGDLELVIAQFGCDQELRSVHVLFVVVGNPPRSDPSGAALALLALPGYSSHQNIIATREMRQYFDALPHAVPLKPSHRCIDPAVSGPLQVGCLLYTSPSPRDRQKSRMPSSA